MYHCLPCSQRNDHNVASALHWSSSDLVYRRLAKTCQVGRERTDTRAPSVPISPRAVDDVCGPLFWSCKLLSRGSLTVGNINAFDCPWLTMMTEYTVYRDWRTAMIGLCDAQQYNGTSMHVLLNMRKQSDYELMVIVLWLQSR